jgi:hypothetical protein
LSEPEPHLTYSNQALGPSSNVHAERTGDLSALPLRLAYRTGRDDLVRDFFVPCLRAAILYRRAAGYFTSASGFLDEVVAIRCLDESIDLPELRMGFLLASSTNPRQFVQRRGRLLRNVPGKERAEIYDIAVPPGSRGKP